MFFFVRYLVNYDKLIWTGFSSVKQAWNRLVIDSWIEVLFSSIFLDILI